MPQSDPTPAVNPRRRLLLGLSAALIGGRAGARTTGSGKPASEARPVADFDRIAVADSIDLVVRQGSQEALVLSGDDKLLPLVESVVETGSQGRTLVIRLRRGASVGTGRTIQATVDVVRLRALASAGSGHTAVEALKTPSLRLSVAGSGHARLDALAADTLEVRVAGSGGVQAAGTAGQVKLTIAGSGDVDLAALTADEVTVSIAGSGDARVTANRSLGVTIAGSGDVVYGGTATAIRSSVAGSGRVSKR